ncbi:unnamed protein product [Amoebophrya sp. A120]|nr:unnamed protein product [Amoebophrya sp. A120]|eukprot:GSA120T00012283001.1
MIRGTKTKYAMKVVLQHVKSAVNIKLTGHYLVHFQKNRSAILPFAL